MGALLAPDEEPAVEIREGGGPFVVVCEHASNRLPRSLGTLGLNPRRPRAAHRLGPRRGGRRRAPRRPPRRRISCSSAIRGWSSTATGRPHLADAVTPLSEDTEIPGNVGLNAGDKAARIEAVWTPFHAALENLLDERRAASRPTALVTVHSFTPVYRGVSRPWHVGIISTGERSYADAVLAVLRREPALVVGDNEPYSPRDNVDYTIRRHGFDRGLPHVMIEIRNDLLRSAEDIAAWAGTVDGGARRKRRRGRSCAGMRYKLQAVE